MKKIFQINIGRLHILLAKNDGILDNIRNGVQKKRSARFDRVHGQLFFTLRNKSLFLNVDWI